MTTKGNALKWLYFSGIYIILCLPLLSWGAIFNPPDWGKNIIFRSITAIMLFVFLWKNWGKINVSSFFENFKKNKLAWILAAYLGIYFLASVLSPDPMFSFWGSPYRGGGFVNFAFYFAFLFLVVAIFDKNDWKKLFDISIIVGLLVSLVAIFQYFGIFNSILSEIKSRPPATMGNPIMLATYLLLMIFVAAAFALIEKEKNKKIFYWASVAVFFIHNFNHRVSRRMAGNFNSRRIFFILLSCNGKYQENKYPQNVRRLHFGIGSFGGYFCEYISQTQQFFKPKQDFKLNSKQAGLAKFS
jgi:hypothetical protein